MTEKIIELSELKQIKAFNTVQTCKMRNSLGSLKLSKRKSHNEIKMHVHLRSYIFNKQGG